MTGDDDAKCGRKGATYRCWSEELLLLAVHSFLPDLILLPAAVFRWSLDPSRQHSTPKRNIDTCPHVFVRRVSESGSVCVRRGEKGP